MVVIVRILNVGCCHHSFCCCQWLIYSNGGTGNREAEERAGGKCFGFCTLLLEFYYAVTLQVYLLGESFFLTKSNFGFGRVRFRYLFFIYVHCRSRYSRLSFNKQISKPINAYYISRFMIVFVDCQQGQREKEKLFILAVRQSLLVPY